MSTQPPIGFDTSVDREFTQVKELLQPGKRQRDEARGRIRTLLAMESHVAEGVEISEADIDRLEKAIRAGKPRSEVFPRLGTLDTQISGSGATVTVRSTKKEGEGAPVRYIAADDPVEAAAVREVDLQKRFHMSATKFAKAVNLTTHKSLALHKKLAIDADPQCVHIFVFGKSRHPMFSHNALERMRGVLVADSKIHPTAAE